MYGIMLRVSCRPVIPPTSALLPLACGTRHIRFGSYESIVPLCYIHVPTRISIACTNNVTSGYQGVLYHSLCCRLSVASYTHPVSSPIHYVHLMYPWRPTLKVHVQVISARNMMYLN